MALVYLRYFKANVTRLNQFTIVIIYVFDQILSLLFVFYVNTTTSRIGNPKIVSQDRIIY